AASLSLVLNPPQFSVLSAISNPRIFTLGLASISRHNYALSAALRPAGLNEQRPRTLHRRRPEPRGGCQWRRSRPRRVRAARVVPDRRPLPAGARSGPATGRQWGLCRARRAARRAVRPEGRRAEGASCEWREGDRGVVTVELQ